MSLQDTVITMIAQLDSQMGFLDKKYASEKGALLKRKAVLQGAQKVITPELEAAVDALQSIGIPILTS